MTDLFDSEQPTLMTPARAAVEVTPNDGADLTNVTRAIYCGVGGDLKVDLDSGDTVTFVGMTGGVVLPIRVKRVYATGTTATNIVGLY